MPIQRQAAVSAASRPPDANSQALPSNRSLGLIPDAAADMLDELGLTVTSEMLEKAEREVDEDIPEDDELGLDTQAAPRGLLPDLDAVATPAPKACSTVTDSPGTSSAPAAEATEAAEAAGAVGPLPSTPARADASVETGDSDTAAASDVPISERKGVRQERVPDPYQQMGMGFNSRFSPPGSADYLKESYYTVAWRPEAKDSNTQTHWEPPPAPPPPRQMTVYEQLGESVLQKTYRDLEEDDTEEAMIRRAAQRPFVDPDRPNVAVECCCGLWSWLVALVDPFTRLPCSRRIRRWVSRHVQEIVELPYLQNAYSWMSVNGGVLRYACLGAAAGSGLCTVIDLVFVEGAVPLWRMDLADMVLLAYMSALQAAIVLYELPPSADLAWVHALIDKWALFLTRLLGRGSLYLFTGSLTAAKFHSQSFAGGPWLRELGMLFGASQASARHARTAAPTRMALARQRYLCSRHAHANGSDARRFG